MASLRDLPEALAKIAKMELNENPDQLRDGISELKIWANKQQNFKCRTSDQFLAAFMRGCKHSLERSKEKLEKYYLLKANMQELYSNRQVDDPVVLDILKQGIVLPLLKPNGDDGPVVHIIRAGSYDPNKVNFCDIVKVGTIIADIYLLENDNAVISGLVEILDLAKVTAHHLFHIDVSFVKKFAVHYEDGMPIRQKGFHFMNPPVGFEGLYNIFKPLISSKNRNRVFIHGSNEDSLHSEIAKDILPKEYGGTCGTIDDITECWKSKFLSYKQHFLEENNYVMLKRCKNNKLEGRCPAKIISEFGIEGSFRKMQFD